MKFDRHPQTPVWADAIIALLIDMHNHMVKLMALIDDLQAKANANLQAVEANTNTLQSIAQLVDGFKQQIADLKAQLDAAGTDPAKLQALSDTMDQLQASINAQSQAEAAITNTPAAP